jgi:acyl-CoA hydrolase
LPRTLTPDEAAALVAPVDRLGVPLGPGQPKSVLHALGRRDDWEDLQVFTGLLIDAYPLFTRKGVHLRSGFFGPVERGLQRAGFDVQFVPADFRGFTTIGERFAPRVVATAAAPPDADGRVSLSLHAGATVEQIQRAARDPQRLLIVEIHPDLPRTRGLPPEHPHAVALEDVDVLVEGALPPFTIDEAAPSDLDRAIAGHSERFIRDGCTLQTGIGAVPGLIARHLAEGPGGDYGIHSEMFTDGLMRLHRAGKVTNRKGSYDGLSITTFAMGSAELHRWLDGNEEVVFLPVQLVNAHEAIGRNRDMVTLNGALAVDLFGQVAADTLHGAQFSGIGGHMDFVAGASLSPGGRSLVCLPSRVGGSGESRIVAGLPADMLVTTPRHEVDVIVTEHGAAELAGRTVQERAEALIAIAAPELRDELTEAWARMGRGQAGPPASP